MFFFIGFLIAVFFAAAFVALIHSPPKKKEPVRISDHPFSAAQYLERMERELVDILSSQEPIDQTIILWWGLDGLKLDKNKNLKWIKKKKKEPPSLINMCNAVQSIDYQNVNQMCQIPSDLQQRLRDMQMQQMMTENNQMLMQQLSSMQTCCIQPQYMQVQTYPIYPMYQCYFPQQTTTTF